MILRMPLCLTPALDGIIRLFPGGNAPAARIGLQMLTFTRALLAGLGAASLLLVSGLPSMAATTSGSDTRLIPTHSVFAANSPFYQKLPANSPSAVDSPTLVASLDKQAHDFYGTPTEANVSVNTQKFAPALYVAYNTDPVYNVTGWNCQGKQAGWNTEFNRIMQGVHIPADMLPDPSTDGAVSIYNPNSNDIVELWQARKVNGQWQACWGGRILNVDESLGVHTSGYGASASGIALWATTIRAQEFLNHKIDHMVSIGIPRTKKASISWPANRSDGGTLGTELSIGQMLRLPASLNIDAMNLSPSARTIAKAAQDYGLIVTDTSGSVTFAGENSIALHANPYPTIFRNRWSSQEMNGVKGFGEVPFPLGKLVALPLNYKVPIATATVPGANTAYPAAVMAAKPFTYWRLNDTKTTAIDSSGAERTGKIVGATQSVPGRIAGNTALRTVGTSASSVYRTAVTLPPRSFSVQLWFNTSTKTGGKLLGRENTMTGMGTSYDRSLYMANDGRLLFGTYYGGKLSTVASSRSYNNGAWHMATATQGTDGTKLYVDGVLVASGTATHAQPGYGYWRLGGGNLKSWTLQPASSWFSGALDEFAVYHSNLSAATIAAQYKAAA
jgi:hypothetical protein